MSENVPGTESPAAATETPVITPPPIIVAVDTVTICHDEVEAKDSGGPSAVHDGERLYLNMSINDGIKRTPEELETYRAALTEPDEEFPVLPTPAAKTAKKAPTFKAVVAHAKADSGYLSALLSALGIQAAKAV